MLQVTSRGLFCRSASSPPTWAASTSTWSKTSTSSSWSSSATSTNRSSPSSRWSSFCCSSTWSRVIYHFAEKLAYFVKLRRDLQRISQILKKTVTKQIFNFPHGARSSDIKEVVFLSYRFTQERRKTLWNCWNRTQVTWVSSTADDHYIRNASFYRGPLIFSVFV